MHSALHAEIENDAVLQAAIDWLVELRQADVSGERVAEWQRWLATGEAHRVAFALVEQLPPLARQVSASAWPTPAQVASDDYDGAQSVSAWRARSQPNTAATTTKRPRALLAATALAAGLGALAFLLWSDFGAAPTWIMQLAGMDSVVDTAAGERRTVALPDGSRITAGGLTRITVRFSSDVRRIELERGEAFFEVQKDLSRPFAVHAGQTIITATGTAFNVRRAHERIIVAVSEGSVRVESAGSAIAAQHAPHVRETRLSRRAQLKAGQQLTLEASAASAQTERVDTQAIAGWREGRLQYLDEPLDSVVADLKRYSDREIRVVDAAVGSLRVTGTVFEANVDGWLESLEATFPISVERDADGAVLLKGR